MPKKEQEYGIYISVGNELLGFYRSIGQFEAAFAVGEDVLLLMEELQLDHTVHFATTLFNVATAYRTAGKYEEALANYRRALEIYQKELPKDDYRLAELYSSISILLEKLNENENAVLFLEKAIQIMEKQPGTRVEVATSRTSLALIELKMDKLEAAEKHLELAISAFKEDGGKDGYTLQRSACRTRRGLLPSGQSGTLPGKL
ncbi:MAG: tetratricopeptide repeat protein [Gallintestinimicrobium sp.]